MTVMIVVNFTEISWAIIVIIIPFANLSRMMELSTRRMEHECIKKSVMPRDVRSCCTFMENPTYHVFMV